MEKCFSDLRVYIALAEVLGFIPSTYIAAHNSYNSSSSGPKLLFGPVWTPSMHVVYIRVVATNQIVFCMKNFTRLYILAEQEQRRNKTTKCLKAKSI